MFTWLNKQGVRSDGGFEVQFTGRFEAQYREGENLVSLYVESGMDGASQCILIDPKAFQCWDNKQPISLEKQKQIFNNFNEAMEFQGLKMVVQSSESPTK